MPAVSRFADVDGGSYVGKEIEVSFTYWAKGGEPNYMRDYKGEIPRSKSWHCLRDEQVRIDDRKAVVGRCTVNDAGRGLRYVYMVNFPKLRVYYGGEGMEGAFSITISYQDARYSRVAERIAKSINFSH
jgi:hypothetical protein